MNISNEKARKKLWVLRALVFVLPVLVIVGAVGVSVGMSALKTEPEEKEDAVKAIPVITANAAREDVRLSVLVQGEVQPRTQIDIVPQVSGQIIFMSPNFIKGGRFKKGDLLLRIDPVEYELRAVQARADIAQAETVLMREKSEGEIAITDWEEINPGEAPSPLTQRIPQMAEAAARLESAKARLAEAELQLARTAVYAPFDGRVVSRLIDQGGFVGAGTMLGEVYASTVMDVRLPMSNDDLRRAGLIVGFHADTGSAGIPVKFRADVGGIAGEWDGHIVRTDSRFDSKTRVLYAYGEVRDPFAGDGPPLVPGLFVAAEIAGQSVPNALVIPRAGLRGKDQVYLANADGTLSIKTANVISSNRDRAIIRGGIQAGDAVVISPIRGVADGMKIEVVRSGETASAGAGGRP